MWSAGQSATFPDKNYTLCFVIVCCAVHRVSWPQWFLSFVGRLWLDLSVWWILLVMEGFFINLLELVLTVRCCFLCFPKKHIVFRRYKMNQCTVRLCCFLWSVLKNLPPNPSLPKQTSWWLCIYCKLSSNYQGRWKHLWPKDECP